VGHFLLLIEHDRRTAVSHGQGAREAQGVDGVEAQALGPDRHHLPLVGPGEHRDVETHTPFVPFAIHHDDVVLAVLQHPLRLARRGPGRRETGAVASTKGRLLVAEPFLGDPNFERTVVLMLEHADEGALGLVLNRLTDVRIAEALPDWRDLVSEPAVLHIGGPVEERSGWCLARVAAPEGVEGFVPLLGDLGLVDLEADAERFAGVVHECRIYAGYSGWGAGQLDAELAADAWFVVDADVNDPFQASGLALWQRILARQGGQLSRLANVPVDPSLN
jgi:putative transcriptional regulator